MGWIDTSPIEHACCIACGGDLFFLPDSYPLVFHCGNGHFLSIKDLLDESLPEGRKPRLSALEFWERQALLMHQLAERSLKQGHVFVAADFQETAGRVERWAAQLRALLPKVGASSPSHDGP